MPAWVLKTDAGQAATWQADFVNDQYWANGRVYPTFTTWLAALSGTFTRASAGVDPGWYRNSSKLWVQSSANALRYPHYAIDGTTNLGALFEGSQQSIALRARDFTNATWVKSNCTAALSTGASGVANSGSRLTATANGGYATQTFSTTANSRQPGVWMKRVTGAGAINVSIDGGVTPTDVSSQLSSTEFRLVTIGNTTSTTPEFRIALATSGDVVDVDFGQLAQPIVSSPIAAGSVALSRNADVLLLPQSAAEGTFVVAARSSLSMNGVASPMVFASIDDNTNANYVRVIRQTSGNLQCVAAVSSVTQGLNDFGSYSNDTDFKIAYAFKAAGYKASLNGASNQDSVGQGPFPTISQFRIGVTSQAPYGPIKMVALLPMAVSTGFLPYLSQNTSNPINMSGDSYGSGASGVSLPISLFALNSRPVNIIAAGGTTIDQILAQIQALPSQLLSRTTLVWDGSDNGYGTPAAYEAYYPQIASAIGHSRFLFLPPLKRSNMSAQEITDTETIRQWILANYPSNSYDAQSVLGDPVDAGNLQGDGTHLNSTGMGLVATPVNNLLVANGW